MITIYNITFFFLYNILRKKRPGNDVAKFLVLIYLICSLCGAIVYFGYSGAVQYPDRITIESISVHIMLLALFIWPFIKYSKNIDITYFKYNAHYMKVFSMLIAFPAIASLLLSIADVISLFAFGNFDVARTAFAQGELDTGYVSRFGPLGYILALGPETCLLAVIMTFFWIFVIPNKKMATIMFVSSLSLVVHNLSIAGREGIIRWGLYFLLNIVLYKKFISYEGHKLFWKLMCIGGGTLLFVFFLISNDRFGYRDNGTLYTLFNYPGQPFYYFSYSYNRFADDSIYGLEYYFPMFFNVKFITMEMNSVINADYHLNTFPTFVGSFLTKTGLINTLIYGIFWNALCLFLFGKKGRLTFYSTIAYFALFDVVLIGVLYYIHYTRFVHFAIFLYILIAAFISKKFKYTKE